MVGMSLLRRIGVLFPNCYRIWFLLFRMAHDPMQYCPNCEEEKTWDADLENGEMNCPDCEYSQKVSRDDL